MIIGDQGRYVCVFHCIAWQTAFPNLKLDSGKVSDDIGGIGASIAVNTPSLLHLRPVWLLLRKFLATASSFLSRCTGSCVAPPPLLSHCGRYPHPRAASPTIAITSFSDYADSATPTQPFSAPFQVRCCAHEKSLRRSSPALSPMAGNLRTPRAFWTPETSTAPTTPCHSLSWTTFSRPGEMFSVVDMRASTAHGHSPLHGASSVQGFSTPCVQLRLWNRAVEKPAADESPVCGFATLPSVFSLEGAGRCVVWRKRDCASGERTFVREGNLDWTSFD